MRPRVIPCDRKWIKYWHHYMQEHPRSPRRLGANLRSLLGNLDLMVKPSTLTSIFRPKSAHLISMLLLSLLLPLHSFMAHKTKRKIFNFSNPWLVLQLDNRHVATILPCHRYLPLSSVPNACSNKRRCNRQMKNMKPQNKRPIQKK